MHQKSTQKLTKARLNESNENIITQSRWLLHTQQKPILLFPNLCPFSPYLSMYRYLGISGLLLTHIYQLLVIIQKFEKTCCSNNASFISDFWPNQNNGNGLHKTEKHKKIRFIVAMIVCCRIIIIITPILVSIAWLDSIFMGVAVVCKSGKVFTLETCIPSCSTTFPILNCVV